MIINLISGPRNISTALMYSFAQRKDIKVVDEPFYAHYLCHSDAVHPGTEEVLDSMNHDYQQVWRNILELSTLHEHIFIKNMAHHLIDMDLSFLNECRNVFLIRDPKNLIASIAEIISTPIMRDIGLKRECELFQLIHEKTNVKSTVLDSSTILNSPEKGLIYLCAEIGIEFDPAMLSWNKGGIPEDGSWSKYWYKNVHNSTQFQKQATSNRILPPDCQKLYEEALPYYNKLLEVNL